MGTAAVRGQTHTATFTFSPSGYTANISPNVNYPPQTADIMACDSCQANFSFFKKKKLCRDCGRNFCSECVHRYRDPENNRRSFRQCKTCKVLISGNFTRQELLKWKVKDLRFLLNKRNVSTDTCTEKQDIIDLLFVTFAKVRNDSEPASNGQSNTGEGSISRQPSSLSGSTVASDMSPMETNTDVPPGASSESSAIPTTEETSEQREARLRQRQEREMQDALFRQQLFAEEETPQDQPAPRVRMTINNIATPEDAEKLTVKQLKEVLVVNFVDYKGCVEKKELVERVKRLWHENKYNQEKAKEVMKLSDDPNTADKSNEDDVCKICMDAAIDCVLLECGHMVSCTQCGRRLNECPICRQYVVRVVHTFKT